MKWRIPALAAALAATLTGCGSDQQIDDVDFAKYCGDHLTNQVAPDAACGLSGDDPNSRFQWSYADTGHHVWVNGYDRTPDYVFIPVGQVLPYGATYVRPYNYSYHQPLIYSSRPVHRASSLPYKQYKKVTPKVPASAPKAATTAPAAKPPAAPVKAPSSGVQRGGFGVPSAPKYTPPASTPSFSGRTSTPTSPSRAGK